MADEKILLEVEIEDSSVTSAVSEILKAKDAIAQLQQAQKDLANQGQSNSAQFVKNNEDIKTLNKTISDNSKTIQANNQLQKANADSIDALRAANTLLIKEKNSLSTTDEASKKRIAEINTLYDKNTATIKANSSATEQQKMNIGNYGSALDKLVPGLGGVASGIESSTVAAKAFIATPLGAILAAVGLAVAAITSALKFNDEEADEFEAIWSGISATFEVVEKNALKVIGVLGKIMTFDLGGAIKDIQDIGTEMSNAANSAYDLTKASQALQDSFREFNLTEQATKNKIDELILQSKNRTLSEKERIALNQQAADLEASQTQKSIELTTKKAENDIALLVNVYGEQQKVNESVQQFGERLLQNQKISDTTKDKIVESIRSVDEAQNASIKIQEKLQNQRDALSDAAVASQQKALDKQKAQDQKYQDDVNKGIKYQQDQVEVNRLAALDAEQKANEESAKMTQDLIDNAVEADHKASDQKIDNAKREADAKKKLDTETLNAKEENQKQGLAILQVGQNLVQALFGKSKIAAIAETIINGIKGFMQAVGAYPPPIGEILGGLSIAASAKSVAEIEGVTFEEGGIIPISGKSHTAGGEDVAIGGHTVANVQGGEHLVVLKRGAYSLFNQLSRANELAGGVAFANDSAPRRYLADGGFVARSAVPSVPSFDQLSQQLTNSIGQLKIYTRTTDIQKVQDNVAQVKVLSELR